MPLHSHSTTHTSTAIAPPNDRSMCLLAGPSVPGGVSRVVAQGRGSTTRARSIAAIDEGRGTTNEQRDRLAHRRRPRAVGHTSQLASSSQESDSHSAEHHSTHPPTPLRPRLRRPLDTRRGVEFPQERFDRAQSLRVGRAGLRGRGAGALVRSWGGVGDGHVHVHVLKSYS